MACYLDTSTLDFRTITDTYTKIADPSVAVRPEFATERQALITSFRRADGQQYVETENIAEVGDAIITGPEGERSSILERRISPPYTSRCVVRMVRWYPGHIGCVSGRAPRPQPGACVIPSHLVE